VTKAQGITHQEYKPYTGPNPYGGISDDSRSSFQGVRDWISGGNGGATGAIKDVMGAGPQTVGTQGTFDGEGLDKYMSKYTDAALNPAKMKALFDVLPTRAQMPGRLSALKSQIAALAAVSSSERKDASKQ
jgi:hypothetical protein